MARLSINVPVGRKLGTQLEGRGFDKLTTRFLAAYPMCPGPVLPLDKANLSLIVRFFVKNVGNVKLHK